MERIDKPGLSFELPLLAPSGVSGRDFTLHQDFLLEFRGEQYVVPAGEKTDGASIPRWLWFVCGHPLEKPRLFAAIVHDFLYSGGDIDATRRDADAIYRDIQLALGVWFVRAWVEWAALRLFGWTHWHGGKWIDGHTIKVAAAVAVMCLLAWCIEIANVESFVTLPKGVCFSAEKTQTNER